jgi:ribonuclease HI
MWFSKRSEIQVFTDGANSPDFRVSGLAAVFFNEDDKLMDAVYSICQYTTNNEAEYLAVLLGMKYALQRKHLRINIFTDSLIIVQQALGTASVKSPGLKKCHHDLMMAVSCFDSVGFNHISREENRIADAFANKAISLWKRKVNYESTFC